MVDVQTGIQRTTESYEVLYINGKREFIVEGNGSLKLSRVLPATLEDIQTVVDAKKV